MSTARIALALFALSLCAQSAHAASAIKPEDEVKAVIIKWVEAYNTGKLDALDDTYSEHEDVWIVGPVAGDEVWGRDAWRKSVEATLPMMPHRRLATSDVRVRMLRPDIAIVTGRWTLDGKTIDDKPFSVKDGRFTTVVEHRRGKWLVVSDHSSVGMPLTPPVAPAAPAAPARPEDRPPPKGAAPMPSIHPQPK